MKVVEYVHDHAHPVDVQIRVRIHLCAVSMFASFDEYSIAHQGYPREEELQNKTSRAFSALTAERPR